MKADSVLSKSKKERKKKRKKRKREKSDLILTMRQSMINKYITFLGLA